MRTQPVTVNGVDVGRLRDRIEAARQDPSVAERQPVVAARWLGDRRAEVRCNNLIIHAGGEGEFSAMQLLLGALAACDVEVVVIHAALLGVAVEDLVVEASGHFDVRAYLGLEVDQGSGYDRIDYTVRIRAPGIAPEQVAALRDRCERGSPVGDSLARPIPLRIQFVDDGGS